MKWWKDKEKMKQIGLYESYTVWYNGKEDERKGKNEMREKDWGKKDGRIKKKRKKVESRYMGCPFMGKGENDGGIGCRLKGHLA